MSVEQYSLVAHDWLNLEFIINDLASRVIGQELSPGSSPTFAGSIVTGLTASSLVGTNASKLLESVTIGSSLTYTRPTLNAIQDIRVTASPTWVGLTLSGKVTSGSFASSIDVTATREYGVELHYSGNNYDVTGIRSRARLKITNTTATAQGALLQAANSDGINAGVLNGALIEAIGKSDGNAATISTMRGALVNTEWGDYDTVTNLKTLHVRTHSRNDAGAGSFGTGYGIYIENEAVGGNGQAYDAGIYFKGTNLSAGNKAFTYGIDFSGATYGTANIKVTEGGTIGGSGADLRVNSNNQVIINKTSRTYPFLINSTDGSDQIQIYHDNDNAYFRTTDGSFIFTTDEGTDTSTYIQISGKGGGRGYLQVFDEDDNVRVEFRCGSNRGYLSVKGTNPSQLRLQSEADIPVTCFQDAVSGETQEFQIYGYRTGDVLHSLQIGIGVDANDTASFDGVSNYYFDGNVGIGIIDPSAYLHIKAGTAAAGTAPLKFTTGTNLTTPEAGVMEYDGTRFYITGTAARRVISRGSDSIITPETVHTSVAETTVFTASLPADTIAAGKVYEIFGYGKASTHDASATLTIRLKINGTVLVTVGEKPGAAADDPLHYRLSFTARTIGVTGTISSHGDIQIKDTIEHANVSSTVINTTGIITVTVTFQWDASHASNTATLDQGFMKLNN